MWWCFFDESYPTEGTVAVVTACMMSDDTVRWLEDLVFRTKRKYYGRDAAKDQTRELKGSKLLSNQSFKMLDKHGSSTNQNAAREVLSECAKQREEHPIEFFAAAVYGAQDVLKKMDHRSLTTPLAEILHRVSAAARSLGDGSRVSLVFDEQLAELDTAISTRNFIAGSGLPNVSHFPLAAVSHVTPGLQLADIGAYIIGRRAVGDVRFKPWYERLKRLQWKGEVDGKDRWGFQRWEPEAKGGFQVRRRWE